MREGAQVVEKASRIPTREDSKNRGPADIVRRYPDGRLDIHCVTQNVVDLIERVKDINLGGKGYIPLNAGEKALLTLVVPGVALGVPKAVAKTMLRLSSREKALIQHNVIVYLRTMKNWNAGRGGGSVDGSGMVVDKSLEQPDWVIHQRKPGGSMTHARITGDFHPALPTRGTTRIYTTKHGKYTQELGGKGNKSKTTFKPHGSNESQVVHTANHRSTYFDGTLAAKNHAEKIFAGKSLNAPKEKREDKDLLFKDKLQRSLLKLADTLNAEKAVNPWAVCTASVGREDKAKYERCIMDVKAKQGVEKAVDKQRAVLARRAGQAFRQSESVETGNTKARRRQAGKDAGVAGGRAVSEATPRRRISTTGRSTDGSSNVGTSALSRSLGNLKSLVDKGDQRTDPKTPEAAFSEEEEKNEK